MIAKITTGTGLRGCLNYDLLPKRGEPARARWVAGTLTGTPKQMSRQAAALRGLRAGIAAPIWRCSLSLPPADGRRSPDFWSKVGTEFLIEMGVDPSTAGWCMVQHDDRDHDHCHITLIRCQADGSLFDRANDVKRAIKVTQLLEQRHQLQAHSRDPPPKSTPTLRHQEISKRTGKPMSKIFIQEKIDAIFAARPDGLDFAELNKMLEADIIDAAEKRTAKGKLQGISFRFNGVAVPASELGSQYSTKGLIARGLRIAEFVEAPTAESNTTKQTPAEQITVHASTAPAASTQQRDVLDRPPQQLQPIPQALYSANQMLPQGPVAKRLGEVSERLDEMAPAMNTQFLNCAWALAKVAVFCATAAANIAAAVWRFLQRLLALFNLKTKQPLQFSEQSITPQLTYNPTHGERALDASELAEVDKNAASAIDHVLGCVESGRPDDLPEDVEGRAELIAAMATNEKKGTSAATEADPLDAMFDDHQAPPLPKSEPKIAPVDTFVLLNTSMAEFVDTSIARTEAGKRDTPQVAAARKSLAAAEQKLQSAKLTYLVEKNKKGMFKRFVPSEAVVVENEQIAFNQAEKSLATAIQQHPSTTPPELIKRHADALAKIKAAAAQHHAKMLHDVDQHANAKVKKNALYQAQSFKAHLDIFERAPISGHLHEAVLVAEQAPKSISTAITIAAQEEEMAARRNVYVPGQARNDDDTDGQR